jgi:hypothetical protein
MSRVLPSSTQVILDEIVELKHFYGVFRLSDQLVLDEFFEAISQYQEIMRNTENLRPMELMPLIILLEEYRKMDEARNALLTRLESLRRKLDLLSPTG